MGRRPGRRRPLHPGQREQAARLLPRLFAPSGEVRLADPERAGGRDFLALARGAFTVPPRARTAWRCTSCARGERGRGGGRGRTLMPWAAGSSWSTTTPDPADARAHAGRRGPRGRVGPRRRRGAGRRRAPGARGRRPRRRDARPRRPRGVPAAAGARPRAPVLLLTARDAVADRVAGLEAGADDYLVKPFAVEELLARLAAIARRGRRAGERARRRPAAAGPRAAARGARRPRRSS